MRISEDGKMKEIWRIEKSVPHIPSPIVLGEFTYLWGDNGIVSCVRTQTGETLWRERTKGEYYGSPVSDGKHIFNVNTDGVATAIPCDGSFSIITEHKIGGTCRSTAALANNTVFLRIENQLYAFKNKSD